MLYGKAQEGMECLDMTRRETVSNKFEYSDTYLLKLSLKFPMSFILPKQSLVLKIDEE